MKTKIAVTVSISNYNGKVFQSNEVINLEPKGYAVTGTINRTASNVYNSFDAAKRIYKVPSSTYQCNIRVNNVECDGWTFEDKDIKISVRLSAMGKNTIGIAIVASITDAISVDIKNSTVLHRADSAANAQRVRDIARGKQAQSELAGAGLPSRLSQITKVENVSIRQMMHDEDVSIGALG